MKSRSRYVLLQVVVWSICFYFCVGVHGSLGQEASSSRRSTKAYIVKEGDTLWAISKRFLDNGREWPRVWERNPHIKNPHWIYPGDPVYLYTELLPAIEESWATDVQTSPRTQEPTTETAPPSSVIIDSYISGVMPEEEISKVGIIVGMFEDKTLLAEHDGVYVQLNDAEDVAIGQRYAIVRIGRTLYHPRTGTLLGKVYQPVGYAEIVRHDPGRVATARIISSRDVIRVGDVLQELDASRPQIVRTVPHKPLEGHVVCSASDHNEIAQHDMVFITLGYQDGVEIGNQLLVVQSGGVARGLGKEMVTLPEETVARLTVVKTDRTVSTALVEDSQRTFGSGAIVRTEMSAPDSQ